MAIKNKIQNIINDNDSKEILIKGFSFLVIRFLGLFMAYVFMYLVTKKLGASVYGLISICFSLFLFSSIIGRLGLDINLVKFYATEHSWKDKGLFYKVWLKAVSASIIIAIVLYILGDTFAYVIFNKPELKPYILWIALTIPFWTSSLVCAGLMRAKKINNWYAFLNNPGRFTFTTLSFLVINLFLDTPLNAIKAHFFGVLALAIVSFFPVINTMRQVSFVSNTNSWVFLKESFPMMLSSTILIILGWLDTFILGIFDSAENVGIYNVALRLATLTSFTLQAINSILAPKLAKFHQEENITLFKKSVKLTTTLNFYTTLTIVIFIVFFNKPLLNFFGAEFLKGSVILIILCFGQLINSISGSVGTILQMIGKQKVYQNIVLIALFLNITLNLILIPLYGGHGAAIATAISIGSWNILGAFYLKKKLGIQSYYSVAKIFW